MRFTYYFNALYIYVCNLLTHAKCIRTHWTYVNKTVRADWSIADVRSRTRHLPGWRVLGNASSSWRIVSPLAFHSHLLGWRVLGNASSSWRIVSPLAFHTYVHAKHADLRWRGEALIWSEMDDRKRKREYRQYLRCQSHRNDDTDVVTIPRTSRWRQDGPFATLNQRTNTTSVCVSTHVGSQGEHTPW